MLVTWDDEYTILAAAVSLNVRIEGAARIRVNLHLCIALSKWYIRHFAVNGLICVVEFARGCARTLQKRRVSGRSNCLGSLGVDEMHQRHDCVNIIGDLSESRRVDVRCTTLLRT